MSCNGCRVLRKGCSEGCALRPCLQWIESPESQGFATLFVAKFFGRAGLMEFISAVPENERTALFQSLLYEACGRTVNPVYGAVGLLWSGKWHICQEAVETVLSGGNLHNMKITNHGKPVTAINSATSASSFGNFNLISKNTTKLDQVHAQQQHALINNMRSSSSQGALFNGKPTTIFTTSPNLMVQSDQILAISSSSTKPMNFAIDGVFTNPHKRLKVQQSQEDVIMSHGGNNLNNNICNNVNNHGSQPIARQPSVLNASSSPSSYANGNSCLSLYRRVPTNSYNIINTSGLNITTTTNSNTFTHGKLTSNNSREQPITIVSSSLAQQHNNVVNKIPPHGENQKVELDLSLKSDHQTRSHDLLMLNSRVSSPCSVSEGSIVTTMESPINPTSSCHQLSLSLNSSRSSSDIKLLNLLV